jgi:hypothetical protein
MVEVGEHIVDQPLGDSGGLRAGRAAAADQAE